MGVHHVQQGTIQKIMIWIIVNFVNQEHILKQVNLVVLSVQQEHIHLLHLQFVYHVQQENIHQKRVQIHVLVVPEGHIQYQEVFNVWNVPQVLFPGGKQVPVYLVRQENILLNQVLLPVCLVL